MLSWNKTSSLSKVAASALAFTIVLQAVLLSTVVAFERKNIIHGTVEIARAVETEHRSHAGSALRLFFPFASPYRIMEFAAYLSSRGVPVEGAPGDAGRFDNVILATRTIDGDGPCMEWRSIRCHAMNGPHPGDLVIILPDDEASRADTIWYREQGAPRFFYDVSPPISKSLYPLIFDIASLIHVDKTLPDRWMHGCVTLWK
jgi:hypothetical protein